MPLFNEHVRRPVELIQVGSGSYLANALGTYQLDSGAGAYVAIAIDVLALRGGQISEIIAFREPEFFARVGLPEHAPVLSVNAPTRLSREPFLSPGQRRGDANDAEPSSKPRRPNHSGGLR